MNKKIPSRLLKKIGKDVLLFFQKQKKSMYPLPGTKDYHGFMKAPLPLRTMKRILHPYNLAPEAVQIEVVTVLADLTHEAHVHRLAHAFIMVLGKKQYFDEPRYGYALCGNTWISVTAGQIINVPPGTPHTVTILPTGIVHFLSVQAPPIECDGKDDYYRIALAIPFPNNI